MGRSEVVKCFWATVRFKKSTLAGGQVSQFDAQLLGAEAPSRQKSLTGSHVCCGGRWVLDGKLVVATDGKMEGGGEVRG